MVAEELINEMIPPLKPSDKVRKAIQWMEELRVNELPVIDQNRYQGLVSEDLIYEYNDENAHIRDLDLIAKDIYVLHNQHFYDILRIANAQNIQVIAILGEEQEFVGVVTVNDTLNAFADTFSLKESGGILVLLIDKRDYSLSEVSRIIESNNAKILSTYISDDKQDINKMKLTIKINRTDLNAIVATFERYNYRIIAKFHSAENHDMDKERLELLFKYLSI